MKLTHFKYKTRKGPDYRHGEQVSFMDIKQTFGMGSIRVGAWVNQDEKDLAANLIFDSLADLAYILALPPEAIGLRGTLGLAFGSGGQKGVQAHYAPNQRELALAKNAGAGALAHEFWHAFDHYIAEKVFEIGDTSGPRRQILFASDCWLHDRKVRAHPLNERLLSLFDVTLLSDNLRDKHDYVARSVIADQAMPARYFSLPTEMMARAFEAAIESCSDIKNAYLVAGTTKSDMYPVYPDMTHREQIYQALQGYFAPLGRSLSK
ncbi:CLCA_X family protein [uncultured Vibrio sp.]|uniref:CLCA_X family protein n=1 Tax=uncultured Vibrio sp. TaxID=114054 RepID=UPI002610C21F|nr:CLCA_X family protein [uncultured Vibrio sp.]